MKKIILAGGGDKKQSRPVDEFFVKLLSRNGKVLYIPIAWKTGDFKACYQWFVNCFSCLGLTEIGMWTNLQDKTYADLEPFKAIYIGGGNTFVLLSELRKSGFNRLIKQFIESGRIVMGGSAGAIILGKNIETAAFCADADENIVDLTDLNGLDVVNGYTIQCHYAPEQEQVMKKYVAKTENSVIALTVESGVYIQDDKIFPLGTKPTYVFKINQIKTLIPTNSQPLCLLHQKKDAVEATYDKRVLKVVMPKTEVKPNSKVKIKVKENK